MIPSTHDQLYRDLGASDVVRSRSEGMVTAYLEFRPGDRDRLMTLHASALYMSFILVDEPRSQEAVANAAGISPTTLRRWYKRMASVVRPRQH